MRVNPPAAAAAGERGQETVARTVVRLQEPLAGGPESWRQPRWTPRRLAMAVHFSLVSFHHLAYSAGPM